MCVSVRLGITLIVTKVNKGLLEGDDAAQTNIYKYIYILPCSGGPQGNMLQKLHTNTYGPEPQWWVASRLLSLASKLATLFLSTVLADASMLSVDSKYKQIQANVGCGKTKCTRLTPN